MLDGARIDSSTLASGLSGSLIINASDSISVDGGAANFASPSLIISSANVSNPFIRTSLNLPTQLDGKSGSIILNTNQLNVFNGAQISVRNDGISNGGSIQINAASVNLDNKGSITASTTSGEGGNISLIARNSQLRNSSSITATAGEAGNGGNISIDTDTLVALKNSDITARAFEGNGGSIQISTQGLFFSSDSEIDASSIFGINGVVEIQTFGLDVKNSTIPLQNRLVTTEQALAGSCIARRNIESGSFVVTGSGGLPINPYSGIERWDNLTGIQSAIENTQAQESALPALDRNAGRGIPGKWKLGDPIVEAQTLIVKADGRASLVASSPQPKVSNADSLVCHDEPKKS